MSELSLSEVRKEVVKFMNLVATRNRTELEYTYPSVISSLEDQEDPAINVYAEYVKGLNQFFHNNYQEAKVCFEKIMDQSQSDSQLRGIASMGLGFTNRSAGHLDEAVANLTYASELIDHDGDFATFIRYIYQSLGEIHIAIEEFQIAIDYLSKAFNHSKEDKDGSALFRFHIGLGNCYMKMKEYEKSQFHLTEALKVKDRPPPLISRVENDLGVLYKETKQYDKAEKFLKSSLAIREENHLEDAACTTMSFLAEVYLEQDKAAEALDLLNHCRVLVEKYKTDWKKLEVLRLMARANNLIGNHRQAADCYEEYINLYEKVKGEQEKNILKFKNEEIEKQRRIISQKHNQLAATLEEVKRLKVNRKAVIFSWLTIVVLVVISEVFIDPWIEKNAYNGLFSLLVKVIIALLFKPLDGMYANILWNRAMKQVS